MPYVGYVEFFVPDEEATADFDRDVFDWKPEVVFPGYLNVQNGDEPGINTGIAKSDDGSVKTVATLLVPDLDASMEKVEEHGGKIAQPKFPIAGVGHACYCTDRNGMTFGMWEADTTVG